MPRTPREFVKGCKELMRGGRQMPEALRGMANGIANPKREPFGAPMREAPAAAHCECRQAGAGCGGSEAHSRAPSVAPRSAFTRRFKWNFVHIMRFKRADLLGFFGGWKMFRDPIENSLGCLRIPKRTVAAGRVSFNQHCGDATLK